MNRVASLPAALAAAGLALAALFAATRFPQPLSASYGTDLMLLALLLAGRAPWRELAAHPFARLLLLFAAYGIAQAALAAQRVPDIGFLAQLSAVAAPVKLGAFACVIGWWLAERPRWAWPALALMLSGMALWTLVQLPWGNLAALANGSLRLRLGYAENLVGMLAAIAVLGLVLQARRGRRPAAAIARAAATATLTLGLVLFSAALLFAQSRGAWLALALTLPLASIGLRHVAAEPASRRDRILRAVAGLLALLLVAGFLDQPQISARLHGGWTVAQALLHGDRTVLATSSVGLRLDLYALGIRSWLQAPLLGWGLRSVGPLIAASGLRWGSYVPPHLHDAYLQIAVGLGAIGLALLTAMCGVLLRDLWRARRLPQLDPLLCRTLLGSLAIVLIVNAFDFLLWSNGYMRAPLMILLGAALGVSFRLRRLAVSGPPAAAATTGG